MNTVIDTDLLAVRLAHLNSGGALMLRHEIYGNYKITINSQGSVISGAPLNDLAKKLYGKQVKSVDMIMVPAPDGVTNQTLNYLLLWNLGDWFIYKDPVREICTHCAGNGYIESIDQLVHI